MLDSKVRGSILESQNPQNKKETFNLDKIGKSYNLKYGGHDLAQSNGVSNEIAKKNQSVMNSYMNGDSMQISRSNVPAKKISQIRKGRPSTQEGNYSRVNIKQRMNRFHGGNNQISPKNDQDLSQERQSRNPNLQKKTTEDSKKTNGSLLRKSAFKKEQEASQKMLQQIKKNVRLKNLGLNSGSDLTK